MRRRAGGDGDDNSDDEGFDDDNDDYGKINGDDTDYKKKLVSLIGEKTRPNGTDHDPKHVHTLGVNHQFQIMEVNQVPDFLKESCNFRSGNLMHYNT